MLLARLEEVDSESSHTLFDSDMERSEPHRKRVGIFVSMLFRIWSNIPEIAEKNESISLLNREHPSSDYRSIVFSFYGKHASVTLRDGSRESSR